MRHAWTGGQYSVYRFVLAAVYAASFVKLWPLGPFSSIDIPVVAGLAIGLFDRIAAVSLAAMAVIATGTTWVEPTVAENILPALLLAHVFSPGKPYGSWAARSRPDPGGGWRMPRWHPFAWLGPGWIPPKRDAAPARLFYDGECGLCHRAVRFVLAEDPDGRGFRFAPLASATFEEAVPAQERAALPDSIVLRTPDGRTLVRSDAVREIAERLGGLWRVLALASRAIPTRWLDRAYDRIAAVRKRIFTRPADACPLVPAELRARFD